MDTNTKERKGVFSDVYVEQDMVEAKKKLYDCHIESVKLSNQITPTENEISKLINNLQRLEFTIKDNNSVSSMDIKYIKEEMDKIAFMIEHFVDIFHPIYEKLYANYTAMTLAGSYKPSSIRVEDWGETYVNKLAKSPPV